MRTWAALAMIAVVAGSAVGEDAARVPISRMPPAYPELARRMKVFGTVRVQVTVLRNGNVGAAKAMDGHPLLQHEAEMCVRQWRFMPGPKESTFTVAVDFELGE